MRTELLDFARDISKVFLFRIKILVKFAHMLPDVDPRPIVRLCQTNLEVWENTMVVEGKPITFKYQVGEEITNYSLTFLN